MNEVFIGMFRIVYVHIKICIKHYSQEIDYQDPVDATRPVHLQDPPGFQRLGDR